MAIKLINRAKLEYTCLLTDIGTMDTSKFDNGANFLIVDLSPPKWQILHDGSLYDLPNKVVLFDSAGDELFTSGNPGNVQVTNLSSTPVYAQLTGSNVQDVTFHDAATEIGDGASLTVNGLKTLTVGITSAGGNSARTIQFRGVDAAGNDNLMTGVKLSDLSTGSSTTATGETWQFDITGLDTVYMPLTAITDGIVTVKGKAVA